MTDKALLGAGTEPGTLDGQPIPAWMARELITDPHTRVVIRRLYTHPTTRQLVAMDKKTRLFTDGLKRFVVARDQYCRTPWCGARIRHIDHVKRHSRKGRTCSDNGQGLCEACNLIKESFGWISRLLPPSGFYTTRSAAWPTSSGCRTGPPQPGRRDGGAHLRTATSSPSSTTEPPPDIEITTPTGHRYVSRAPARTTRIGEDLPRPISDEVPS